MAVCKRAHLLGAVLVGLLIAGGGQAHASAGCTAFAGNFQSANFGYHGTSSSSGFTAGDKITVTVNSLGNSNNSYFLSDTTSAVTLIGQTTVSASYTFPADTSDTIEITVNNVSGGGLDISWLCTPGLPPPTLTLSSTASATMQVGQSYSQTNIASGGTTPYTYSVSGGSLPAGTSLNPSTGTVSGTPTTAGAFGYTIKVTDNGSPTAQTKTQTLSGTIGIATTTTSITSSVNPSSLGQSVTFTAIIANGGPTVTGTVTFNDGTTALGIATVSSNKATFTTPALTLGIHSITAAYGGDSNNTASTSTALVQAVNVPADSIKLREMQVSAMPVVAQISGQAITGAMGDAIDTGFAGNPQALTPNGSGFTYHFDADPRAQGGAASDQDGVKRFLASPDGRGNRFDDDFSALGYARQTKAPRPAASPPAPSRDWLAWIDVRGTSFDRTTFGSDLKGVQVNAIAGLTRRVTPDFLVGVLGGYEHFDFTSQALTGVLKGDGWTTGAYLGWRLSQQIRFDAGVAWSDILANVAAGTAAGSFTGNRWLATGGVTGIYGWQAVVLEPSAHVYALWEHENSYTDSLGILQTDRNFETGRASGGVKASYPLAWSSAVKLAPYAGLYGDYYFSRDDELAGLTTVPLLQGWSARATGGVAMRFVSGGQLTADGEYTGIGGNTHIWTYRIRGSVPF